MTAVNRALPSDLRQRSQRTESLARFVRFAVVGLSGVVVNELAFAFFAGALGWHYVEGAILATQCSTLWNFLLVDRWAFRESTPERPGWQRLVLFAVINNAALFLRIPLIALATDVVGINYLLSNLLSLAVIMAARFAIADGIIWRSKQQHPVDVVAGSPATHLHAAMATAAETLGELETPDMSVAATTPAQAASGRISLARLLTPFTLTAILAATAFFRIWDLNGLGLNTDEAVYAGQGASIAGQSDLSPYFPIFRAHPLLFQTMISVLYQWGVTDYGARLLAVAFGVGTVVLVYLAGREIWSKPAGLLAAFIVAVMPYHVVVSRQVLLDGPMTFFTTLALFLLAKFARTKQPAWLSAAAGALALSFLSKETTIIMVGSAYAFLALAPGIKVKFRHLLVASAVFFVCILPYPLSLKFAGTGSTGNQFLAWQLFRRPNHTGTFYFEQLPSAIGVLVLGTAVVGAVVAWRRHDWTVTLLLSWITVPFLFFSLWPVKGFQYMLPIAAPVAILAAIGVIELVQRIPAGSMRTAGAIVLVALVALPLAASSWGRITPSKSGTFLAGSGGVPGGREAGQWVNENVPVNAHMLALGPSMANIIQFYGHRKTFGLSVSPNPLHRNPVYEPVINADQRIRTNEIQYLIWDSYSASRSEHFSSKLLQYVDRYHGRAVFNSTVAVPSADGSGVETPVITVYEVRP